jgi:tetratricopeptide (TPR) repeat protein
MSRRHPSLPALLLITVVLAACESIPPSPPPAATPAPEPAMPKSVDQPTQLPALMFEQRQREQALAFARRQRLADAALTWEVLLVLRPDSSEYRERLAETRRQIDALGAERLARALPAAQRGDLDGATQQYLAILALQPTSEPAADALRALERERNRRNYLGKSSRITLTRRAAADAEMAASPAGMASGNELEHATLLAGDGEFDEAIALLERRLRIDRRDAPARRLLARIYFGKAGVVLARDRNGAIAALEKSARLDPEDSQAATRLRQLRKAEPVKP